MPQAARVIDADAHINENPMAWTGLEQKHPGWFQLDTQNGLPVALIQGKHYPKQVGRGRGVPIDSAIAPKTLEGAFNLDQRIADLDTEGIDVQVLYGGLSIGTTSFADAGFAADFAQAYNDWLLGDICAAYPDRLKAVCGLPLQDVDRAIAELERIKSTGAVAVTIPPVVGERNLDDPSLLPFFEAVEDSGLAVGVHSAPGMNVPLPAAGRFDNYVQVHILSFPVDQMVAFTALACGGVLDRFPKLRVAFLEAGVGWVPYFIDRVHEHREKRGDMVPDMQADPAEYIARGQCYFTFECEDEFVPHYVEHLGADSIVFASDYPHWDCDFPGTVDEAREHIAQFDDETQTKLLQTNAERLYGLAT